jgi:hypothetical protein
MSWGRVVLKRPPGLLSLRVTSRASGFLLDQHPDETIGIGTLEIFFRLVMMGAMQGTFGIKDYIRAEGRGANVFGAGPGGALV